MKQDKLSLSSVLENFNKTLEKSAAESKETKEQTAEKIQDNTNDDAAEKVEKKEKKKPVEGDDAVREEEKTEKKKPVDSDDAVEVAEKKEKTATADSLKAIAKTASENSEKAMTKEAEEFGRLFAHTVMDEMEKVARENEEYDSLVKQAYELMSDQIFMDKLAHVYEEAYGVGTEYLIRSEAYTKTAGLIEKTAKNADAVNVSESAEAIIKEAYEMTQRHLDQRA